MSIKKPLKKDLTMVSIDTTINVVRPSHKELNGKIVQAKEALSEDYIELLLPDIIAADALDLSYLVEDIATVLSNILNEITPNDYTGTRPPQRSYEDQIKDCELFAFRWTSRYFGCEVYLKFALKDDVMWLVSLHQHREGGDE